jgi:outer membrane cobalamin receptor
MFIKDYGFNSGIKTISLNATQSEHTLVLLDGIRLNSRQNALTDLSLYDIDNADRIEISKGGSSALYGSEAIGGVINIISSGLTTSKPFGADLRFSIASYGIRKIFARIMQKFSMKKSKNLGYEISISDERGDNDFEYNYDNGFTESLKRRENADYSSVNFRFNTSYTPNKNAVVRLFSNYSDFKRGVPGPELGYASGTARQTDENLLSALRFVKTFHNGSKLNIGLDHKYSLQKYYDPATFNLSVVLNSFYRLNTYLHTLSYEHKFSNLLESESGYEVSYNTMKSNETGDGELLQGAVFTSWKLEAGNSVLSKMIFYPSIRYDYFSNIKEKNVLTGKIGINIKPFSNSELHLKSSFGNNFSAPTFNELYWLGLGNKDLRPEKSICFDAGIYYRIITPVILEPEVSYYNINTTDRIVWTPNSSGIWRPLNVGKVKSEGIDAGLRSTYSIAEAINISFSFNYSYGSALKKNEDFPGDPSYNKQLIYLPEEMIKSSFMFNYLTTSKSLKFVSFNLFYRFSTRRYTNFENTLFQPRFDELNGNISAGFNAFGSVIALKFVVNNILNEDYQAVSGYPMPLRNFKVEISYKY